MRDVLARLKAVEPNENCCFLDCIFPFQTQGLNDSNVLILLCRFFVISSFGNGLNIDCNNSGLNKSHKILIDQINNGKIKLRSESPYIFIAGYLDLHYFKQ